MKFLVFSLALLSFSCGEKKEEEAGIDKKEVKLYKEPQTLKQKNIENGTLIHLLSFEDPEYFEFASSIADAQSNAWGKSIYFGFIPDIALLDIKSAIHSDDYGLSVMANKVSDRLIERCPSSFQKERALIPSDLVWDNGGNGGSEGYFTPVFEWRSTGHEIKEGKKAQSIIYWSGSQEFKHKIVLRSGHDNEKKKSYFHRNGEEPWNWDYKEFNKRNSLYSLSGGEMLGPHDKENYADFTLVHEMGHWFVEDLLLSEGKISTATVYFLESIARLTSAFCYVAHIEDRDALQEKIDFYNENDDPYRYLLDHNVDKYWPLSNHFFEGEYKSEPIEMKTIIHDNGQITKAQEFAYEDHKSKLFGLSGLIMAYVLEGSYDPDLLADKMFESIGEMKGRKLECRKNDESCARTNLMYDGREYPESAHPYVLTLAEFLEVFTAKIDVPERAKLMWDSYIKLMNEVEK